MHHITLEKTGIIRTIKLNLQLNDEAYKILVKSVNENPNHDNIALYYWMISKTCSKYHYNKIWRTFNRLPGIKLTILD